MNISKTIPIYIKIDTYTGLEKYPHLICINLFYQFLNNYHFNVTFFAFLIDLPKLLSCITLLKIFLHDKNEWRVLQWWYDIRTNTLKLSDNTRYNFAVRSPITMALFIILFMV